MKNISEELADWADKHEIEASHDAMFDLYMLTQRRLERAVGHARGLSRDVHAAAARLQRKMDNGETIRQRLHKLAGESWSLQRAVKKLPPEFDWDAVETCVDSLVEDADSLLELCRLLPATALQNLFHTCAIQLEQEGEQRVEHPSEVADRLQRMLRTYTARLNAAAAERAADAAIDDDADCCYGSLGQRDRGFGSGSAAWAWLRAYEGGVEDAQRDQLAQEARRTCVRALLQSLEANWTVLVPNDY
jgi:hypothetical protein